MSNQICPKCKTQLHWEESIYCHECGAFLINHCSNSDCDLNNGQYDDEQSILEDNDKFCYLCGEKTTFNQENYFSE